jgi:hypothetical protein
LKRETCPALTLNGQHIPQGETAKYLGIHLDLRLTWEKHIFTKRKQLGFATPPHVLDHRKKVEAVTRK